MRFLQQRTFRALGADKFTQANVRIIAASNGDLECRIQNRSFRADLFFRLNVLALHLPPLRARRSDVELLAQAALRDCGTRNLPVPRSISTAALRALSAYHWPGNVRELFSVVQRAAVCCDGSHILPEHLSIPHDHDVGEPPREQAFRTQRAAAVAAFERQFVETLLRKHGGNVTRAAREAQQDRRAFGRIAKKHGIDRRTLAE